MGQKVNPTSYRIGVLKGWDSVWFSNLKDFATNLKEDDQIRSFIKKEIPNDIISKIIIERTLKVLTLTIHTSRPGIVIGPGGEKIQELTKKLKKKFGKTVQINVQEIKRTELDATIVAKSIAKQISGRARHKRIVEDAIKNAMRVGVQGIKIQVAGRINGAEIARKEKFHDGRVPLHTIRADIDYAKATAKTIYGAIGIKVWIFLKEVYGKRDLSIKIAPSSHRKGAPSKRMPRKP
ncbi:MAG: 30S ribosomal protein S3 [Bacteroidota bacterium]